MSESCSKEIDKALLKTDLESLGQEIDEAFVQIIDDWFTQLKSEESKDTFAAAFQAHRMTARVAKKQGGNHRGHQHE